MRNRLKRVLLWSVLSVCLMFLSGLSTQASDPGFPTYSSTNLVVLKPWNEPSTPTNWPAYISLLIAAIVGYVAVQQHLLSRRQQTLAQEKFKLDLFEKRFVIYKATATFLAEIVQKGTSDVGRAIQFLRETQDAVFLFEQPIADYLDSLYKRAIELHSAHESYQRLPVGEERNKLVNRESELLLEVTSEITKLKDVFGPYLRFKHWS